MRLFLFRGNFNEWLDSKMNTRRGCLVNVKPGDDNWCFPKAVALAQALVDITKARERGDKPSERALNDYRNLVRTASNQYRAAFRLVSSAGLMHFRGHYGEEQWRLIEETLPRNYGIGIWSKSNCNGQIYSPRPGTTTVLKIYHYDDHFVMISSLAAFYNSTYACDICTKQWNDKSLHRCQTSCYYCHHPPGNCNSDRVPTDPCPECKCCFPSQQCFDNHTLPTISAYRNGAEIPSACDSYRRCEECFRRYSTTRPYHHCYYYICRRCNQRVSGNVDHQMDCYMQPLKQRKTEPSLNEDEDEERTELNLSGDEEESDAPSDDNVIKHIFYDFECHQNRFLCKDQDGYPIFAHDVNHVVAEICCDLCVLWDEMWDDIKHRRAPRQTCTHPVLKTFSGSTARDAFCDWLFSRENYGSVALAHNAAAYDTIFILQYIARQGRNPIKTARLVNMGTKVISLQYQGVTLRDTYRFLTMSLAAMPKTFGFENEETKGYFPYLFDTPENTDYIGPWPAAEYYDPDRMKPSARAAFLDWHREQHDKIFNMSEEKMKYNLSDTHILRKCCMEFRTLMLKITGIDVFAECMTTATLCSKFYRKKFLKPNTIALIPAGGYRRAEKQSIKAVKWMEYLMKEDNGLRIQHARNGAEARRGRWKLDGLSADGCTAYEFHGCFWHGCPKCHLQRDVITPTVYGTPEDRYQKTLAKERYLRSIGMNLVVMWECELDELLRSNREMRSFFDEFDAGRVFSPREALSGTHKRSHYVTGILFLPGGRTETFSLIHITVGNGWINYLDFNSLYPAICKNGVFPVGHPRIVLSNFAKITAECQPYFGKEKQTHAHTLLRLFQGLIACEVLPPDNLRIPLLPYKSVSGKLGFTLCRTCFDTKPEDQCTHTSEQRSFIGNFCSLELDRALILGYKVVKIFEVYDYERRDQYDPDVPGSGLFAE